LKSTFTFNFSDSIRGVDKNFFLYYILLQYDTILHIVEKIKEKQTKLANNKLTSIDQALNILEVFSVKNTQLSVTEISKILKMSISTAHRTLKILKRRGYIEQDSQRGKYKLGLKVFELGCVFQNQTRLIEVAMPYLEHLATLTNETINLAVLDQNQREIVYIAKIDSPEVLKTDIRIGTRLFAHCTALGKVLLAYLPESQLKRIFPPHIDIPTYTSNSLSNTDELRECLEQVRRSGFAIDNEEFKEGVKCIAVPLRDLSGRVIAAMSITAPTSRCSPKRMEELKDAIVEVSNQIPHRFKL